LKDLPYDSGGISVRFIPTETIPLKKGGVVIPTDEMKIGVIPKVVVQGAFGPKEYGILLTNKRTLFVQSSPNKAKATAWFGLVGGLIADSLKPDEAVDYAGADIEELRKDSNNISVRHEKLTRLLLKKGIGGYSLRMEYEIKGKPHKVVANIVPPDDLIKQGKQEGASGGDIKKEYVEKIRLAFERAMPPEAAQKIEWVV